MKLAMGMYDSPQTQEQPILYLDPHRSNIAVFGGPMTGKTTFIKSLLIRMHENPASIPNEDIYIIDFGVTLNSPESAPVSIPPMKKTLKECSGH